MAIDSDSKTAQFQRFAYDQFDLEYLDDGQCTGVNVFGDIFRFHDKFGLEFPDGPKELDFNTQEFRLKFMREELEEYHDAVVDGDMAKALDALIDLIFVTAGTGYFHGFPMAEAWRRVQQANMKKMRATHVDQSTRGTVLDVVKPEGWVAPDHTDLVTPLVPYDTSGMNPSYSTIMSIRENDSLPNVIDPMTIDQEIVDDDELFNGSIADISRDNR